MLLGVPTLNRYDLLGKLIASAEAGRLKPSGYLVVDNGGRFLDEAPKMPGVAAASERGASIFVLSPGQNLGVAASWNALLDWAGPEPLAIANDDVELGEDALEALDRAVREHDFVIAEGGPNANGWCLFAQTKYCTDLVGPYDEGFFPAYYEDSDYEHRLRLAGVVPHFEPTTLRHEGWATMRADPSRMVSAGQQRSAEYFRKKWGGMPGEMLYDVPFDCDVTQTDLRRNHPQTGWRRYEPPRTTIPAPAETVMRWDVINRIAEKIGAQSYLEIGVANGENMRHVNVVVKTGVDPNPTIEGVKASDAFVPKTSDEFFGEGGSGNDAREEGYVWNIVFIDGLHYAEQAYRDIMNAAKIAQVVVVHDANPHTEELQRVPYAGGDWCGDVWKAIARIRDEGIHAVRTVDTDFGVAVVIPNRGTGVLPYPRETWADLQARREELLGLIPPSEWEAWFDEAIR